MLSELFRNTSNMQVVSHAELKAILDEFKNSMVQSVKEIALNHSINRQPLQPVASTSGMSKPKIYNPLTDSESEAESELEQLISDQEEL